jgi:hypothetical protein
MSIRMTGTVSIRMTRGCSLWAAPQRRNGRHRTRRSGGEVAGSGGQRFHSHRRGEAPGSSNRGRKRRSEIHLSEQAFRVTFVNPRRML